MYMSHIHQIPNGVTGMIDNIHTFLMYTIKLCILENYAKCSRWTRTTKNSLYCKVLHKLSALNKYCILNTCLLEDQKIFFPPLEQIGLCFIIFFCLPSGSTVGTG